MALPPLSLPSPSARGLPLRSSPVGGGEAGGRALGLLGWRRASRPGAARAMGRKKATGESGDSERPKVQLDGNDLMELEFGRLLGEPRHATLAKVVGRKVDPEASYIDIEKRPEKKVPRSSSSNNLSEAEFARLLSQEGRPPTGVHKPAKPQSSESLPGLAKPPSRPGQPPPQAARTTPSAKPGKAAAPLVTFGPGGFAAQSKLPSVKEDDYMGLVQKPAVPSPDSYKPSWPKIHSVRPMLIGKAKKPVDSPHDSLLRKPTPGDKRVDGAAMEDLASPSEISEERFATLLELAGSSEDHQDVASETSASGNEWSKTKGTAKPGLKPTLVAKLPLDAEKRASMSVPFEDVSEASLNSAAADVGATTLEDKVDAGVDVSGLDEAPAAGLGKSDNAPNDSEQSILRLVKKASQISSVRAPKRFPQATKPKIIDLESTVDERLAGWSDEVKAAVKRSEAALPDIATQALSETEFDQLLQRRKAELLQRPVSLQTPESPPDPVEDSLQQRSTSRPAMPSPKPPRDVGGAVFSEKRISSKEEEDQDWARAQALRESRTFEEVVFTRALANGMLANFGSLLGFLPSYELSSRRRPPSLSTWAQDNGFVINRKLKSSESPEMANDAESSEGTNRTGGADEEHKRLLELYGKARTDILAALVGETAKVVVVAVERERNQLRFSEKEAEGEGQELAQKKAQLMTSLNVGDVVKCTIKKVTNFGAFVELHGVPALIHISELSWNRVTDPSAILDVGQEVDVKVCRLDRYLQRISLSLKQMQPDPLRETLESLDLRGPEVRVGASDDNETSAMPELVGVAQRLESYKGINSVQLGRRIQGNALAPTFQVYLSGQLEDGFKLLARSGNQVQEVLVQTALNRESMKDAIRQCTFSDG